MIAAATAENYRPMGGRLGATPGKVRLLLGCAFLAASMVGCSSVTQTPFARTAADAASLLSAASHTLQFAHNVPPWVTVEYGEASFINYHELIAPIPDELPSLQGAPDQAAVEELVGLLDDVIPDLENPCLADDCDWQGQIARLDAATHAFLDAAP